MYYNVTYDMILCRLWEPANHPLAWTMNMVSVHTSYVDNFVETFD